MSRDAIAKVVRTATGAGFNTLLVQVRGRGEAFYHSDLEPRASDLDATPATFDPLATALELAHAAGLKVHAWVNVNLVASGDDAAAIPRARRGAASGVADGAARARRHAARASIRDRPATSARSAAGRGPTPTAVEGLYLSPLMPAAQDYTVAVVNELLAAIRRRRPASRLRAISRPGLRLLRGGR